MDELLKEKELADRNKKMERRTKKAEVIPRRQTDWRNEIPDA